MKLNDRKRERIFILLPGILLFYSYILPNANMFIKLLVCIQLSTHLYLQYSGKECNPQAKNYCNFLALIIGIIFLTFVIYKNVGIIPLFIASYMVLSHIITLRPFQLIKLITKNLNFIKVYTKLSN